MNTQHWTNEDLLNHLYGVGPENEHLGDCDTCRERWLELSQTKRSLPQLEISACDLAAQRQQILSRIEKRPMLMGLRWASAACAASLVCVGLWLNPPRFFPHPAPPAISKSDAQLLREVSAALQDPEPRASAPLHEMFVDAD